MASPDLRKARSIADGKIMLVPTHVEIATPSDSGSDSSSSSDEDESSSAESSVDGPTKQVQKTVASRPNSAKVQTVAERSVRGAKARVPGMGPKQNEAEASWTRLQFAQAQLASHLASKQQRIGSAKRVAEADARRRAEKHPFSAPNEYHTSGNQSSVPKPPLPVYPKQKRLSTDSGPSKRPDDEAQNLRVPADSTINSDFSRSKPQRPATTPAKAPYALVKRIAVRGDDRADRLAQLERQIREQLGTIAAQAAPPQFSVPNGHEFPATSTAPASASAPAPAPPPVEPPVPASAQVHIVSSCFLLHLLIPKHFVASEILSWRHLHSCELCGSYYASR